MGDNDESSWTTEQMAMHAIDTTDMRKVFDDTRNILSMWCVLKPIFAEIETYFSILPKLITDGHEGEFIVIHGQQYHGLYQSFEDALRRGRGLFPLPEPLLIHRCSKADLELRKTVESFSMPN